MVSFIDSQMADDDVLQWCNESAAADEAEEEYEEECEEEGQQQQYPAAKRPRHDPQVNLAHFDSAAHQEQMRKKYAGDHKCSHFTCADANERHTNNNCKYQKWWRRPNRQPAVVRGGAQQHRRPHTQPAPRITPTWQALDCQQALIEQQQQHCQQQQRHLAALSFMSAASQPAGAAAPSMVVSANVVNQYTILGAFHAGDAAGQRNSAPR